MGDMSYEHFSVVSEELVSLLSFKEYNKGRVNSLIDEVNAKTYKAEFFARSQDVISLVAALCSNIRPSDEFLAAKSSHLINIMVTKQNVPFTRDYLWKPIAWHIECLKKCSEIIMLDILHNLQSMLQCDPIVGIKFTNELLGNQGILINIINIDRSHNLRIQNPLQTCLTAMKCIVYLVTALEENKVEKSILTSEMKEQISTVIIRYLMKGCTKNQDDFLYCKVVTYALRVLSHLYFHDQNVEFSLPDVMGICKYYILYGIVEQNGKPERIMPSQQIVAAMPVKTIPKGGKKQKVRKHRNNAIESLKKEIPVSDRSLMKDVGDFENNSAYKPVTQNYLETFKGRNCWALTSDSDMSDMENGREAKLIALKSRVRQSASNLFLVLFKIKEKKEIFGYWWALLPDLPNPNNLVKEQTAKNTLSYCALTDPIVSSRTSALSVILALLGGSKVYLSQAEACKKTTSFIPFSISLGYITTCLHKVLTSILDNERSHSVILLALKCCVALVQATPYHKMQEGLISDLVRSTRKFLVHKDVQLQVGALMTIGCVLSVDPKVDEILKALEKDSVLYKVPNVTINQVKPSEADECDDFEEGYSDDDMFTVVDNPSVVKNVLNEVTTDEKYYYFKSWILDICFKNLGWIFKGKEILRCKPSAIPVMLESLQVLSAIAFHHLTYLLHSHITLLADILEEILQHEHHDLVSQAARTVSIIGDAIQKLEQVDQAPPLNQCVYMWQKLLTPLASVLQAHESTPAKAVVCDCIANIGERSFKELPSRQQMFCCALLVGSCSDEEAAVRAAAVRALAMTVMYRSLREDICFVSDCGENILRALAEPISIIRTKAAWALGNLSDALVLNMVEPDIDSIDDGLLLRLLEVSVHCANDNDKGRLCGDFEIYFCLLFPMWKESSYTAIDFHVLLDGLFKGKSVSCHSLESAAFGGALMVLKIEVKMSATRGLGNFLRLLKNENLIRSTQMKNLCEVAIEKLLDCACKVSNMKVRWNACYALGNAMKNEHLFTCLTGWQGHVFSSLCALALECKNLKVRINAAVALRACSARDHYGAHYPLVWRGAMAAMENAANVDDFTEYQHKDNLIEQLCVTLAHLCCLLKSSDLTDILDPLVFHFECAKSLLTQLYHKLPPENSSCFKILQAARYVTMDLTAETDTQTQSLGMLQEMFIWDV